MEDLENQSTLPNRTPSWRRVRVHTMEVSLKLVLSCRFD